MAAAEKSNGRWLVAVIALALIAGSAALLLHCRGAAPPRSGGDKKAAADKDPATSETPSDSTDQPKQLNPEAVPPGSYKLRSVKLEKTELCANEDVRVTVDAVDGSGDSRWVTSIVKFPGAMVGGPDVIMRAGPEFQDYPERFPTQEVEVEVMDVRTPGVVATRKLPVTIKPCQTPNAGLGVVCVLRSDAAETIACTAGTGRLDRELPFKPVRYEWTFIEPAHGKPITTTSPTLSTAVPLPLADRATVTLMIAARAIGPAGEIMEGRGSISVANEYFMQRENNHVLNLRSDFISDPADDKKPRITVELGNPHAEAITVEKVEITTTPCGENAAPSPPREVKPQDILGTDHLAGGQTVKFDWSMPADPQRCWARAEVTGHGDTSGLVVRGVFIMDSDPKMRTALSAEENARMVKALKILSDRAGHPVTQITPMQLHQLEEEGLIEEPDGP